MGAALLLQTLAAPLGAALLSWRWPRLGYLWGALALWLVGCLLGGAYGLPVKAWQWLPLCLLVPAVALQLADKGIALALFAVVGALVWWQGLASVLASEPRIWLALLPAIAWFGWTGWRGDSDEGLGFALGFIWLALVIGIDGSLLIAQLAGALAAFAGFRALLAAQGEMTALTTQATAAETIRFAVTDIDGLESLQKEMGPFKAAFEAAHDDYNAILLKSLADRLAEALAECLHKKVRTDLWGYAAGEALSNDDLIAEKYQGIRPAPGYPACPDHSAKKAMFDLLQCEDIGMGLTESLAMTPAASVSGFYLAHPEAQYFSVGKVGDDQVQDLAQRSGVEVKALQRLLAPNL